MNALMSPHFTDKDAGCYGDGTFGHQHTRERCANILELVDVDDEHSDVVRALRRPMSDDAWEEDAACDVLRACSTEDAGYWGWQDGDFGLWPVDTED